MYETARARSRAVNRAFKWVLGASLALHVGVFGVVVYAQSLHPKLQVHDTIPVELVRLGKPRDPALLPRIAKSAPPPPADDTVALDTGKTDKTKPAPKPDKKKTPELSDAARRTTGSTRRSPRWRSSRGRPRAWPTAPPPTPRGPRAATRPRWRRA